VSGSIDFISAAGLAASHQEELQTQVINMAGDVVYSGSGLSLEGQSLRSILTAAADVYAVVFVFRDYGILITTRERAATMNAPTFRNVISSVIPLKE
jgi:hypothetical protein